MKVVNHLACAVMFIFNFNEVNSQFECLPNGAPIPGIPRGNPSPSASGTEHPSASPHFSTRCTPHDEPSLRSRFRSPPTLNGTSSSRLSFPNVFGYGIDQLEFIRLIPYRNPQRKFELRRYTFPAHNRIELLKGQNLYGPIPAQEQIVLHTSDEEVRAILDSADTLAGMYTYNFTVFFRVRAKINIKSGKVTRLTSDEIKETPVGRNRQILYGYRVEHLNNNHESLTTTESRLGSRVSYATRHISLPTRLPSSDSCGYALDQLQFIRLIPLHNPNQIFELRRYTFPADKLILFLFGEKQYEPIPIQEVIVLTTYFDEVFAILERTYNLAGIYTYTACTRAKVRVKMNMRSGIITQLTKHEMKDVPVGSRRSILHNFWIQHVNRNLTRHPKKQDQFATK